MSTPLQYDNLIVELDKAFPEFPIYLGYYREAMEDNVTVYLTFFSSYITENWQDEGLQRRVAAFMEKMQVSPDKDIQMVFDDFLLGLYNDFKEAGLNIQSSLQLSTTFKGRMLYNYNYWIDANQKVDKGSR